MIVMAIRDIFFATELTQEAVEKGKKLVFVATDRELEDAIKKKPALVVADLKDFQIESLQKAKKAGSTVIGLSSKADKKAEKVCDAVINKKEIKDKLPEILEQTS